jgi:hypothetical protein
MREELPEPEKVLVILALVALVCMLGIAFVMYILNT